MVYDYEYKKNKMWSWPGDTTIGQQVTGIGDSDILGKMRERLNQKIDQSIVDTLTKPTPYSTTSATVSGSYPTMGELEERVQTLEVLVDRLMKQLAPEMLV